MRCLSCKEEYSSTDAGTCKECYDEAIETEEELRREITDLKSRIALLSFLDHDRPLDPPSFGSGCCGNHGIGGGYRVPAFADIVLVGSEDDGDSVPVPANRAVLAVVKSIDRGTICCALLDSLVVKLSSACNARSLLALYNAKILLHAALCLRTDNMDKLTNQAEYRQLVEKDARLVVDIYEAYLSKQVNTSAPRVRSEENVKKCENDGRFRRKNKVEKTISFPTQVAHRICPEDYLH